MVDARTLDVRLLGPVTMHTPAGPVDLGPRKQRLVFATLALEANTVVAVERLVGLLWPVSPPRTAVHAVRVCASALRTILREAGEDAGVEVTIDGSRGGYRLVLDPLMVDAHRFRDLVDRAAESPDDERRLALLDAALALWTGPPLVDTAAPDVRDQLFHGLDEARLGVIEDRAGIGLRRGEHTALVGDLRAHVEAHPLRERLVGQLMLALYRSGRVDEALAAYRQAHARLADRLGLDPGPALRTLERQMLRRDPALDLPRSSSGTGTARAPVPGSPVPANLPPAVAGFVGRESALAQLDGLLRNDSPAVAASPASAAPAVAPTPAIAAIGGTAGVGKTTLALHWAHRNAARFPDGQLYVNLRGFEPAGPPLDPAEAVRGFLDALAVPPHERPDGPAAQANLFRSRLAGRRMLLVLDNAASAEQVRPLLPGAPGCRVLVTSRDRLLSLVAAEGALAVPLDLLTPDEGRLLLADRLGADRVEAEPAAVAALVEAGARLPLALAIVAARAATTPGAALSAFADELRSVDPAGGGLDLFHGGDAVSDVRAVLSWSYRVVGEPAKRMFRLLGLHPGPEVDAPAAASVAAVPVGEARALLRDLSAAHLLTEPAPGRFTRHDLLRAYAAELADHDEERDAALLRMLDHYLHGADRAATLLDAFRDPVPVGPAAPGVTPLRLDDHDAALRWFETEYPVLLGMVRAAAAGPGGGSDAHAWQLACTLTEVFERLGHWDDWAAIHSVGLAAAVRAGDRSAQGHCHVGLGRASMWLRRWDDAVFHYGQALSLFEALGDRDGQARVEHNLGYLHEHRDEDWDRALAHSERALALFRGGSGSAGLARSLNAVGWYRARLGRHADAVACCTEALDVLRTLRAEGSLSDRRTEAWTWDSLGYAYQGLGDHPRAVAAYRRALDMMHDLGDRFHEADCAEHLGDACAAEGDPAGAAYAWKRALDLLEALAHPRAEAVRAKLAAR